MSLIERFFKLPSIGKRILKYVTKREGGDKESETLDRDY